MVTRLASPTGYATWFWLRRRQGPSALAGTVDVEGPSGGIPPDGAAQAGCVSRAAATKAAATPRLLMVPSLQHPRPGAAPARAAGRSPDAGSGGVFPLDRFITDPCECRKL